MDTVPDVHSVCAAANDLAYFRTERLTPAPVAASLHVPSPCAEFPPISNACDLLAAAAGGDRVQVEHIRAHLSHTGGVPVCGMAGAPLRLLPAAGAQLLHALLA